MKSHLFIVTVILIAISCTSEKNKASSKEIILAGNREAPLGWVYLTIYEDSTFVFKLTGLRSGVEFPGKASIVEDTIHFNYTDSVPRAGTIAIIRKYNVSYINGTYPENIGITMNKLKTVPN